MQTKGIAEVVPRTSLHRDDPFFPINPAMQNQYTT